MKKAPKFVLAIESAICGGSISIIRDGREVANWIGSSSISKAEDLLFNIDTLLTQNNFSRREIDLIAVSAGPGSFTGIRIGVATALGLKAGLGISMSSQSALRAMILTRTDSQSVITAVPVGPCFVCLQSFKNPSKEIDLLDTPHTLSHDEFMTLVQNEPDSIFVLHAALYENVEQSANVINFGANIACAIGLLCRENIDMMTEPLFISK